MQGWRRRGKGADVANARESRRQEILQRRKDVQAQTIEKRRRYNRALRELTRPPSNTRPLGFHCVRFLLVANTPVCRTTQGTPLHARGEWIIRMIISLAGRGAPLTAPASCSSGCSKPCPRAAGWVPLTRTVTVCSLPDRRIAPPHVPSHRR